MVDPTDNWKVVSWLQENSRRRAAAIRVWAFLPAAARPDTGEVPLSRGEIAKLVRTSPDDLSTIMMELVRCGAISRELRGREVRYFINPPFLDASRSAPQGTSGAALKCEDPKRADKRRPCFEGERQDIIPSNNAVGTPWPSPGLLLGHPALKRLTMRNLGI